MTARRTSTPRPAHEHRLLLVRHALGHDGGVTRFLTLADALRRRGGQATIVAGGGPLEKRASEVSSLVPVDWSGTAGGELGDFLARVARGHIAALVGCLPQTLPIVPRLAQELPVHLCVHAMPEALERAFAGHHTVAALAAVLRRLGESGRVLLSAASEGEAREHERLLGLSAGAMSAFPNGVDLPAEPAPVSAGPIHSVALVSRLTRVKLPHVAAAAELVAAGRAAGRDATLHVYGAGPVEAEAEAVALIESRLRPAAWHMHGATNRSADAIGRSDVVVGGGRACLEALALGRRVAPTPASAGPEGRLGAPVTAETLGLNVEDNFSWRGRAALSADRVWRELESLDEAAMASLQRRVRSELSAEAMLDRELELLDELDRRPERPDALLAAATGYAAELGIALGRESRGRVVAEGRHHLARERVARLRERVARLRAARRASPS